MLPTLTAYTIFLVVVSVDFASACYPSRRSKQPKADFNPKTSEELEMAITKSKSGNVIALLPKDYEGEFQIAESKSVTIKGTSSNGKSSTIISGGTAIEIKGNNWTIQSLTIKGASTGIDIQGSKNKISSVSMMDVGEGVFISGDENTIQQSSIKSHVIGLDIEIGNRNKIESSSFSGSSPSLFIAKGTSGGSIISNSFKGKVTINGDGYTVTSNSARGGFVIQGCNNKLRKNSIAEKNINRKCNQIDQTNSIH